VSAADTWIPEPVVDPKTGVPFCSESCRHHDGKRCRIMGFQPGAICEPTVIELVRRVKAANELAAGLTVLLDSARKDGGR
jgi:hypothetical protein